VLGGLVYMVGVGDGPDCREVLQFDPASAAWSTLAPTSRRRRGGASFVLGGCLYATGGPDATKCVERYDVASNTWTADALANMLEGRLYSKAVIIGAACPAEEQDLFDSLIVKASIQRP
jgi:hypothetical protein